MKSDHYALITSSLVLLSMFGTPVTADTSIVQTISVSSDTGGQRGEGVVREGTEQSSVDIVTVVNGVRTEVHEKSSDPVYVQRTYTAHESAPATTSPATAPPTIATTTPKTARAPRPPEETKERAAPAAGTSTITHPTTTEHVGSTEQEESPSLVAQVVRSVRNAITYVLHIFFS
jgi:hypothetical protein